AAPRLLERAQHARDTRPGENRVVDGAQRQVDITRKIDVVAPDRVVNRVDVEGRRQYQPQRLQQHGCGTTQFPQGSLQQLQVAVQIGLCVRQRLAGDRAESSHCLERIGELLVLVGEMLYQRR